MATPVGSAVPYSGDTVIDSLVQGSYWSTGNSRIITYAFYDTAVDQWSDYGRFVGNYIFQIIESYINIDFVEVAPGSNPLQSPADIGLFLTGDVLGTELNEPGLLGAAVFPDPVIAEIWAPSWLWPTIEGDVFLESFHIAMQYVVPGGYGWTAGLHEILHAIGMKHPHDGGGSGRPTFSQIGFGDLDNNEFTVMSYQPVRGASLASGNPSSPMVLDVAALQYIYGANLSFRTGNDVYFIGEQLPIITIWDAGGWDILSGEQSAASMIINLGQAGRSGSADGGSFQYVAVNTTIEGAIGSNQPDLIGGNEVGNVIEGRHGNDTILGFDGPDTLYGEHGDDDVNGNTGSDFVYGGPGADFVRGGQDNDWVFGEDGDDWHVNGNIGNDRVDGGPGNDRIFGGPNNDTLWGGTGRDTLSGDLGNDALYGGNETDMFQFANSSGVDTIHDFDVAGSDVVRLFYNINGSGIVSAAGAVARLTASGNGSRLDLGGGNSITFAGVAPHQFSAGDFWIG